MVAPWIKRRRIAVQQAEAADVVATPATPTPAAPAAPTPAVATAPKVSKTVVQEQPAVVKTPAKSTTKYKKPSLKTSKKK
jgi:hypothetical protein